MANQEHAELLKEGVEKWNQWRRDHPSVRPDLRSSDFSRAVLIGANLQRAKLHETDFTEAVLSEANLNDACFFKAKLNGASLNRASLIGADLTFQNLDDLDLGAATLDRAALRGAKLRRANLYMTSLVSADLSGAHLEEATLVLARFCEANLHQTSLVGANAASADFQKTILSESIFRQAELWRATFLRSDLTDADFSDAHLCEADMRRTICVNTSFARADMTGVAVHGISAWDLNLDGTIQSDLNISPIGEPPIRVDNLEVAQFIYLLLNNQKIRHVIDTITSKVVLILGRFTPERKTILDAIRDELRNRDYLPVLFDFEKPANRDITETVSTLAHMARFVIADITDAKSIPQELMRIVPALPSVPVQPLLLVSQREYGMFEHFRRYPWVLEPFLYADQDQLLASLDSHVVGPAEKKAKEQMKQG